MVLSLATIDNFLAPQDVEDLQRLGRSLDYSKPPVFDGHEYKGFCPIVDQNLLNYLALRIAEAFGQPNVVINMAAFVMATEDFRTQQWIHSDNSCSSYAGVFYLFDKPGHGTSFWRHSDYGHTLHTKLDEHEIACLREHGGSPDHPRFTSTDVVDSLINRLVVYPTARFHSRTQFGGFGSTVDDCRLTIVLFFDFNKDTQA